MGQNKSTRSLESFRPTTLGYIIILMIVLSRSNLSTNMLADQLVERPSPERNHRQKQPATDSNRQKSCESVDTEHIVLGLVERRS